MREVECNNFCCGFLPGKDPLIELPEKFSFLDELADALPDLLTERELRPVLNKLDPVSTDTLKDLELNRAHMIYSFLASAYVHAINEDPVKKLPKGISLPLVALSKKLEKEKPNMSYDAYALYNWRRRDRAKGLRIENLDTLITFTTLPDEKWFILTHTEIEDKAVLGLQALKPMQDATLKKDIPQVTEGMLAVDHSTASMVESLKKMAEGNNPEVYYKQFRPYLMSLENVEFEGIGNFNLLKGETGAQSSILPSLDAALGVAHLETGLTKHIDEMRRYMPKRHREFIENLEKNKFVLRGFVKKSKNRKLKELYNNCLDNIYAFRNQHLEWADLYIKQKVDNPYGSGGTIFMDWLKQLRDETKKAKFTTKYY